MNQPDKPKKIKEDMWLKDGQIEFEVVEEVQPKDNNNRKVGKVQLKQTGYYSHPKKIKRDRENELDQLREKLKEQRTKVNDSNVKMTDELRTLQENFRKLKKAENYEKEKQTLDGLEQNYEDTEKSLRELKKVLKEGHN